MFILLFFLISSFANASEIVNQSRNVLNNQKEIVVGLVIIGNNTYSHEWKFSIDTCDILTCMGAKVLLIDYNQIVDFDKIEREALSEAKEDRILAEKLELDKIIVTIQSFIKKNKINRIFIAANYHNLDSDPYLSSDPLPLTLNLQLVTKAIVKIVEDNPDIHAIAVCSGLQGVVYTKGVEIILVNKLVDIKEQEDNSMFMIDPQQENIHLHKIKIVPESRLGNIVSKFVKLDENGWFSIYFPNTHSRVVDAGNHNKQKLEYFGYKIVGFSEEGTIEAIEDKHGNLYFQDHPEALLIKSDKNYHKGEKERKIATLVALAILNNFLYRE